MLIFKSVLQNNELGFLMYKNVLKQEIHSTSNLIFSPQSASTMLAMIFLGARGDTSWEVNELLHLDEMITFNPHLLYKNVTDSLMMETDKLTATCVKQLFIDQASLNLL